MLVCCVILFQRPEVTYHRRTRSTTHTSAYPSATHTPVKFAWQAERPGRQRVSRVSRKLTSWNFGVLITCILIPYPRVSLVYGSMCSLLVLFYYKCLLRLNSDIAKPLPVFQRPRKSLKPTNWEFSRNSVRRLPIQ